jgi:cytochrome c peroxidase
MQVFYGRGRCNTCHSGNMLTDNDFESVGVPQISFSPFSDDVGQEAATGNSNDRYFFKTPSLRNIGITGPYMHDGAFENLNQVVAHYNNISASLNNYRLPASYQGNYQQVIQLDTNGPRNQARFNQVPGRLRRGLRMSPQDQADLVQFLQNALTDESFRGR